MSGNCWCPVFYKAVGMEEKERRVSEGMFKGIGSINEHCFGRLTKEKKETGWLITRKDVIIAELNVNISELSTT